MTKKVWNKPQVTTLRAGDAENGPVKTRADGPGNGTQQRS